MKAPDTRRRNSALPRTPATASAAGQGDPSLRMRDLVRESGLPRETIHFYLQQGLLPEPVKTGRNTALYTREHLERLQRIRELQERQFLPLKAIRAVLDATADEGFTSEQEDLVRRVRASLGGWTRAQQRPTIPVADFVPARLPRQDLRGLVDAGLVTVHDGPRGGLVSEDDADILECWARFREAGFGPKQGLTPADLGIYDAAMEQLVAREARLALRAYAGAPVEELSRMVELTGPVVGRLLGAMHRKRLRRFIAEAGGGGDPVAG